MRTIEMIYAQVAIERDRAKRAAMKWDDLFAKTHVLWPSAFVRRLRAKSLKARTMLAAHRLLSLADWIENNLEVPY